jgi:TolB-like protein/DNA-binding winged helix-turn-helix (wHTH) protein/Tfp pilus assembly protein PilF
MLSDSCDWYWETETRYTRWALSNEMNDSTPAHVIRFGVFELDTHSGELRRHGLKVRCPDQSFQILKKLLSRPGEVISREELRGVLWASDTFGDFDIGLNSAVRKLREALDDSADNPRFVETLPRRGYRFIAPVSLPAVEPAAVAMQPMAAPSAVARDPESVVAVPAEAIVPHVGGLAPIGRRAILLIVLGAAVLAATGAAVYRRGGLTSRRDPGRAAPIHALLVLPFENLTGDASQDYFADSVTDALTVNLAQVEGLDVISRTTALQYRQTGKRLSVIGRELSVSGIVSGTVVRSGTGVRITAQLGRVSTDHVEWGKAYEGQVSHMLDLQQQIAREIAAAAGLVTPASRRSRAIASEAYDAYLKGLTAQGQGQHNAFRTAIGYFEKAVTIEPDFAEAYAALALTQMQFLFGGPFSPHETVPKAEAAARKAMQLDETLAHPHRVLGQILGLYHWRWEDSAKELQRAADLQNGRDESALAMSLSLMRVGRLKDAIAAAERGHKLDPLSINAQIAVGATYRAGGDYDRAVAEFGRALEMSPGNNRVHFQLGTTFVEMGRIDDAIRELDIAARPAHGHNSRIEAYLGYAYAAAGRTLDARAVLKELDAHRRDQYVSAYGIALIHDALGERQAALAAVERACEDRAVEFAMVGRYPAFKTIASEPRFLAVMRQVGLPH